MTEQISFAKVAIKGIPQNIMLNPKIFSTGSTGFCGSGKLQVADGEKYTININIVLIGSKPKVK
jgi:hypothetical protein